MLLQVNGSLFPSWSCGGFDSAWRLAVMLSEEDGMRLLDSLDEGYLTAWQWTTVLILMA